MKWLNNIVDELVSLHPKGEIIVSSGVSPSGKYHLGTLREVLTAEAIRAELKRRGRVARHLHIVDDLDVFRKVPVGVPEEFKIHLGKPLADIPAPDGSQQSYADYFLADLLVVADKMNLRLEIIRAHTKYRSGFFVPAIEEALVKIEDIKQILTEITGRKLDESWSPIQVIEDGYLKTRQFKDIDEDHKTIIYIDHEGQERQLSYAQGEVKLSWRLDWPARWWLLKVDVEPFGRDHATKGGSYDSGKVIVKRIFAAQPPLPLPYHFINRSGETKKMSKSAGNVVTAGELLEILPPEIVWYFILRAAPERQLFFDEGETLIRLFDEFAEVLAKPNKTEAEKQLLDICLQGVAQPTVSNIPFSHLVASYQASLKDVDQTIELIKRTEHAEVAERDAEVIRRELKFIDNWLDRWAPTEYKFSLQKSVDATSFSTSEREILRKLSDKIAAAAPNADGAWFHSAIYELKENLKLEPKATFSTIYRALIGQDSGPRAGWFLSILPREWLIKRLRLEA